MERVHVKGHVRVVKGKRIMVKGHTRAACGKAPKYGRNPRTGRRRLRPKGKR